MSSITNKEKVKYETDPIWARITYLFFNFILFLEVASYTKCKVTIFKRKYWRICSINPIAPHLAFVGLAGKQTVRGSHIKQTGDIVRLQPQQP